MNTDDSNTKKSYKKIIMDNKTTVPKENKIVFTSFEDIVFPSQESTIQQHTVKSSTSQYLLDILQQVGDITQSIKEYYEFFGFANDITLSQVLDCIEKSVVVEIVSDMESENNTDDDENLL
jgi:hypothetical protein